jgi:hypothetical protein
MADYLPEIRHTTIPGGLTLLCPVRPGALGVIIF